MKAKPILDLNGHICYITPKQEKKLQIKPSPVIGYVACLMDESYTVIRKGMQSTNFNEVAEFCRKHNNGKWPAWRPEELHKDGSITSLCGILRTVR